MDELPVRCPKAGRVYCIINLIILQIVLNSFQPSSDEGKEDARKGDGQRGYYELADNRQVGFAACVQ